MNWWLAQVWEREPILRPPGRATRPGELHAPAHDTSLGGGWVREDSAGPTDLTVIDRVSSVSTLLSLLLLAFYSSPSLPMSAETLTAFYLVSRAKKKVGGFHGTGD